MLNHGRGYNFRPGLYGLGVATDPSVTPNTDSVYGVLDRAATIYTGVLTQQATLAAQRAQANAAATQASSAARIAAANARASGSAAMSSTTKWLIIGGVAIVAVTALGIFASKRKAG